ncbi:MAG: hypothetical protein IPK18_12985 [Sphingobacteriales bacterium]|nr:MAG: hypothetical protein IPK18_12985 [Sphingobacteriales bacterium]
MKATIWKISFMEMKLKGQKILQQQQEITFVEASKQVKWMKENSIISKELKENRNQYLNNYAQKRIGGF